MLTHTLITVTPDRFREAHRALSETAVAELA